MSEYPDRQPETVRPFRLWNPQETAWIPHRWYINERRAHDAALVLIRWEHTGASIEVLDARTMAWRGTYSRRVDSVRIETLRKVIYDRPAVLTPIAPKQVAASA